MHGARPSTISANPIEGANPCTVQGYELGQEGGRPASGLHGASPTVLDPNRVQGLSRTMIDRRRAPAFWAPGAPLTPEVLAARVQSDHTGHTLALWKGCGKRTFNIEAEGSTTGA